MKLFVALILFAFIQSASDDLYDANRIYNAIMGLQDKYPQGYPWTNSNKYNWETSVAIGLGYSSYGGSGCVAFAMLASDTAFGKIPAYKFEEKSKIRVGDIIRINNDTHSVIVIKINGGTKYIIAEGNYNSSVNYGRIIDISSTGFNYGYTRYPKN